MSDAGDRPTAPDSGPRLARPRRALWISVAVAAVVGLLVWALATRPPAETVAARSPLVGRPAPAIAASTIDGSAFSLAGLRGRWVVLNYFATWCIPCRMEHADLVRFQAAHEATGDASVVAIVYDDSSQAVREFRTAEGGAWPMVEDPKGRIAIDYGVAGVPESFLIDPKGVVVAKLLGGVRFDDLEALLARAKAGEALPRS